MSRTPGGLILVLVGKAIAALLKGSGIEVRYTGMPQAALKIVVLMKQKQVKDGFPTGRGIVPEHDMVKSTAIGVGELFALGAMMETIVRLYPVPGT